MPQVEFSEEEAYKAEIDRRAATMGSGAKPFSILEIPKKLGLARDEEGSNVVLIMIAIISAIAALIIFLMAL